MIGIHAPILFEIDDGAGSLTDALETNPMRILKNMPIWQIEPMWF